MLENRSSHPEVFCKKGIFKNVINFTGKPLCESLFFNKYTGLRPITLTKKRLWHRSSCEYCDIFKSTIFIEHLRWLSLVKLDPSLWDQQNFSSSYFWQHLISWDPSTSRQNSCKTRYPQKNLCGGAHSYCNSNFKTINYI